MIMKNNTTSRGPVLCLGSRGSISLAVISLDGRVKQS
jgi:hypothetical protein